MPRRYSKIVILRSRAASARFADLTTKTMPRTLQTKETTKSPRSASKKGANIREEIVVVSAFDRIFRLYRDNEALSRALEEARSKVEKIASQNRNVAKNLTNLQNECDEIDIKLSSLLDTITETTKPFQEDDESAKEQSLANDQFGQNTMAAIRSFKESSVGFLQSKKQLKKIEAELEDAQTFVKMLEGVKLVADARGMKRRRDETVEDKPDEVRPKLIRKIEPQLPSKTSPEASNDKYSVEVVLIEEQPSIPKDQGPLGCA